MLCLTASSVSTILSFFPSSKDKVDQVQAVEIEESFEDMNEDTVETDYVEFLVLRNQAEKSVIQNTN